MDVFYAYGAGAALQDQNLSDLAKGLGRARNEIGALDWKAGPGVPSSADMLKWLKGRWSLAERQEAEAAAGFGIGLPSPTAFLAKVKTVAAVGLWASMDAPQRREAIKAAAEHLSDVGMLADSLYFVANADDLSARLWPQLKTWLETAKPPRVVIGLSLGGMMLVDTIRWARDHRKSGFDPTAIDLFVTVGSQAPMLTYAGALRPLHVGTGVAMPRWLNCWNPDDYLSYPTEGVIQHSDVDDAVIRDPGHAFPDNHGAYFRNPRLYKAIDRKLTSIDPKWAGLFAAKTDTW